MQKTLFIPANNKTHFIWECNNYEINLKFWFIYYFQIMVTKLFHHLIIKCSVSLYLFFSCQDFFVLFFILFSGAHTICLNLFSADLKLDYISLKHTDHYLSILALSVPDAVTKNTASKYKVIKL